MKRIIEFLRGSDGPSPSQIGKAVKQVTQPHGDPAVRMAAAERLREWGTPAAVSGLLRRFTIQTPSGAVDLEECQQVEEMLVQLGDRAVEPVLRYLATEPAVAYPARALERILPRDDFVARVLGVLANLDAGFGSSAEQRAGLIRALEELEDPRVAPGVRSFLGDPDDDVAIAAIACIIRTRDEAYRQELVDLLATTRDRPRVRREVAEQLAAMAWPMEGNRKLVEANLPEGFNLDKRGRVISAR